MRPPRVAVGLQVGGSVVAAGQGTQAFDGAGPDGGGAVAEGPPPAGRPVSSSSTGIAFDPAGQHISRLDEALGIIKGLLAGVPVRVEGEYCRIGGLDLDVLPPRASPGLVRG